MRKTLLLVASFWSIALTAHPYAITGEFLYLKPNLEDPNFAFNTDSPTTLTERETNPSYHAGFRIEAAALLGCDCQDSIHARFTYLPSTKDSRTATLVNDQIQRFSEKYRYFAFEFLYAKPLLCTQDFNLKVQGGLLYSNIRFDGASTFTYFVPIPPAGSFFQDDKHARFWGLGPEFVANLEYRLPFSFCGNLSVAADGRAALLSSKHEEKGFRITSNGTGGRRTIEFPVDDIWFVTPFFDCKLGLNWYRDWSCLSTKIGVGYEWIYYQEVFEQTGNITFQGPYVSLGVAF